MKWIDEVKDLAGKTVLLRAGLDVPIENGVVVNDYRLRRALPTTEFLVAQGAKVVVLAHIGREPNETLRPVHEALSAHIPAAFASEPHFVHEALQSDDVVILENLRQDSREQENDDVFAEEIASLGDIFVQDAFSVCHREHASIVGVPKHLPSYGGLQLKEEVTALQHAREPEHPALFVLGGAKFKTKGPLIRQSLNLYDAVFVGGALQNEVLAARGCNIGASVVEDGAIPAEILNSDRLILVDDVIVAHEKGGSQERSVKEVSSDETIVDIGPQTMSLLIDTLSQYKMVVWNGPLGWYERGFDAATVALARAIADSTAHSIVGGGDTVAVIEKEGLLEQFDFVSTGGGAMLMFLQEGTLVGIEALDLI